MRVRAGLVGVALLLAAPGSAAAVGAPGVAAVDLENVGPAAASLTWSAPKGARTWVELGRSAPYGVWYPAVHRADGRFSATLTALAPATTYRFRVRVVTATGASDTDGTFTTAPIPDASRAWTTSGRIVVDGQRFYPIMGWWQCSDSFGRLLELGINTFMGGCKLESGQTLLERAAGRAYVTLPIADAGKVDGRGLIGWNYPDEPEGNGIPANALPDLPPAASSGRLRLMTSTYHFGRKAAPLAPGRGHEIYAPYWAKTDVVGFDIYPLQKLCENRWGITLRSVFDIQRQLAREEVPRKPTYQWIETGPLEGECLNTPHPVSPATVHAETWMAIAGGAAGVGFFTHTWLPEWLPFDVAPEIQTAIARTTAEIYDVAPALVGPQLAAQRISGSSNVVVGARTMNRAIYAIAVNASWKAARATLHIPALRSRPVTVFGEGRTLLVRNGVLSDSFEPLGVHIYIAAPPSL